MEGLAVRAADLNSLVVKILLAAGSDADEAQIVADNLVESNLKGHDSHGVGCESTQRPSAAPVCLDADLLPADLTRYMGGIQAKLLKLNQHAKVVSDRGSFILVDGNLGFGQVIGKEATALGIAKCKEHGVAIVGVKSESPLPH